ncbi:MAG: BspA family leucine-rich repeat surface protein [Longimicrobiales bacterium]
MHSSADVGDTGTVGGVTYTKRSRTQLNALVAAENYAPLATTCTSDVTIMNSMSYGAIPFNQGISSWDVSQVTNMRGMFSQAVGFNSTVADPGPLNSVLRVLSCGSVGGGAE